jgi:hypothetical protein
MMTDAAIHFVCRKSPLLTFGRDYAKSGRQEIGLLPDWGQSQAYSAVGKGLRNDRALGE